MVTMHVKKTICLFFNEIHIFFQCLMPQMHFMFFVISKPMQLNVIYLIANLIENYELHVKMGCMS